MELKKLPEKPNIVIIITDQEREVMHCPEKLAEEICNSLRPLKPNLATNNPYDLIGGVHHECVSLAFILLLNGENDGNRKHVP